MLFLGDVRSGGEQVLLGFQDCLLLFLGFWGGFWLVGGFGLGLIFPCDLVIKSEGQRKKQKSSSPGLWFIEVVWTFGAHWYGFARVPRGGF